VSCLYPIAGFRGKVNENGKRPVVFRRSESYEVYPGEDIDVQVPCGKCEGCKADKAMSWAIRCYTESTLYNKNCFVTFTYDEEHCPDELVKSHLQKVVRKIRDNGKEIRYYACGEYGSNTKRPHYHAVIFGQDFRDGREFDIDNEYYSAPFLTEMWGKGNVVVGDFTMATACYTAGYVAKKIGSDDGSFQIMSRKPGIGFPWLLKNYKDVIKTKSIIVEGKELPVPPQYIQWAENNMDNALLSVKEYRKEIFQNMPIEERIDQVRRRSAKERHLIKSKQHQKEKQKI
jgi:hypothetical protein